MKKILFPVFMLIMVCSLASCSGEGSIEFTDPTPSSKEDPQLPDNTNNQTAGGEDKEDDSLKETPEYQAPNASITDSSNASVSTPVEDTVEKVYDSVVSINVVATSFTGSGSGVLFAEDEVLGLSYVVTCFHVIEDCFKIEVILTNGDTYNASVVGGYRDEDLAVLSIEATDLTYASLYTDSDQLNRGSQVVCIGNPLGTLPGSISIGYLSYINREVAVDDYETMTLLQTDVAINSGNSGGGLFNTGGALIGIVNAKYSDEDIEGLGFAIPINTVRSVVNSFLATAKYDTANKTWQQGYVDGDWELGFTISDGRYGSGFGNITYVAYISDISGNDTASGALTLKEEDIITALTIDYKDEAKTDISVSFSYASDLLSAIYGADLSLEDSLIFTVMRSNASQTITVELIQFIYTI